MPVKNTKIRENILLAPYTTFKIGGRARYFLEATTEEEIKMALEFARTNDLPLFVLGGGSNVLISDKGLDGLVLKIALTGAILVKVDSITGVNSVSNNILTVPSGMDWDTFVIFCVEESLAGVECLSGIPGLVGGTPVQNVGAYGQEVSQTIVSVRALHRATGEIKEISNADCQFSYRTSRFNSTEKDEWIILSVTYRLNQNGTPNLSYRDLQAEFATNPSPTLQEVREAVLKIRAAKGMVIVEGDPDCQSAGSFFKNPIVSQDQAPAGAPGWTSAEGTVKIPAAWLIEQAGFPKGYRRGKAGLSTKHTLALTNRGGASATEIQALMTEIQAGVQAKFGIKIHPEPLLLGFS